MAMKKGTSERILADVPEDKVFWCYGSETFKNLHELAAALEHMSEEAFQYHVTKHKNDFSNWARDVIGDTTLASQLRKAPTKSAAASKAKARIAWLKARI